MRINQNLPSTISTHPDPVVRRHTAGSVLSRPRDAAGAVLPEIVLSVEVVAAAGTAGGHEHRLTPVKHQTAEKSPTTV